MRNRKPGGILIWMDFPTPSMIDVGGVRLAVHEAGEGLSGRPPLILVHGWPELAYSWKNQIGALADAGFRVIAPDLKGFGGSDAPKNAAQYDIRQITGDFDRLLTALRIDRAIFCGHDWGGAVVWAMSLLHPARVAGVIALSTPHKAPPPAPPLSIIERRFGPQHYFIRFQKPGDAEALFATDIDRFFRIMFRRPPPREAWPSLIPRIYDLMSRFRDGPEPSAEGAIMSDADRSVYVENYRRSGFHGGINLYRNIDRNAEIMRNMDPIVRKPALFVTAELDLFLPPEAAQGIEDLAPDLEQRTITDCGHWIMWEKPEALNAILIDWLTRKF